MIWRSRPFLHMVTILLVASTALASEDFKTQPYEFSLPGRSYDCDRAVSGEGHAISRLAKFGESQLLGLKVIICDEMLRSSQANGAYHYNTNTLILATPQLSSAAYISTLKHELLHAQMWVALRQGRNLGFHGQAYNSDPSLQNRNYGGFFGLDEILTTLTSLQHVAAEAHVGLQRVQSGDLQEMALVADALERTRWYTGRFRLMLSTLSEGLRSGEFKPLKVNPETLAILGAAFPLQELTSEKVRLVLPASSSTQMKERLLTVADQVLGASTKLEDIVFQMSKKRLTEEKSVEAQKALAEINGIYQIFFQNFPDAVELLKENEGVWLKLSLP